MHLIKNNVERIATDEEQRNRLLAQGYREITNQISMKNEKEIKDKKQMTILQLKELAKEKEIEGYQSLTKEELLAVLKDVI